MSLRGRTSPTPVLLAPGELASEGSVGAEQRSSASSFVSLSPIAGRGSPHGAILCAFKIISCLNRATLDFPIRPLLLTGYLFRFVFSRNISLLPAPGPAYGHSAGVSALLRIPQCASWLWFSLRSLRLAVRSGFPSSINLALAIILGEW
jgi:hypothetical protein